MFPVKMQFGIVSEERTLEHDELVRALQDLAAEGEAAHRAVMNAKGGDAPLWALGTWGRQNAKIRDLTRRLTGMALPLLHVYEGSGVDEAAAAADALAKARKDGLLNPRLK